MVFRPGRRWLALALALSTFLVFSGCGGSSDDGDGTGTVRVLNATADIGAIDVTIDNDSIDETVLEAGVSADTAAAYEQIGAGTTHTLRLKRAGGTSAVATSAISPAKDEVYTVVAWGREGALRLSNLSDDEDEPSSGRAKVRVFNAATDAGSLDIYLTDPDTLLDEVSPTLSGINGGSAGSWADVARGTFRLRVTAKDDKTDLRLDLSDIVIADKARTTIILQPGASGVLVHALVVPFRGTPQARKNPSARARLVAGVGTNGAVSATIGGRSLGVNLRSPSVAAYTLVPAGSQVVALTVNTTTALGTTSTVTAGADYTVLVFGDASAPEYRLIADDNRLPSASTKVRLRLVHAAASVTGGLTLAKDYVSVANDVAYGAASTPTLVDSATSALLQVTSPLVTAPLYDNDEAVLTASGVYSVFMLGGATAPTGVLRRDR